MIKNRDALVNVLGDILIDRRRLLFGLAGTGLWAQPFGEALAQAKPPVLEKPRITIAVAGKNALFYLPLTIAEQLGFFKLEGLDVEIAEVAGVARAQQAVLAGSADVVCGWLENLVFAQKNKQFFQAFVLQCRAPQVALGVSIKTLPDYGSVQDLRGKRVGIAAPGTPSHTVAHTVLARAGLRGDEMELVSVGTPAGALAALRSGQIDALSYMDPWMTLLEQKNELRIVADTRNLKGTAAVFGGAMPATCLYASQEFVEKNPKVIQALTNGVVHALSWLQTAGVSDLMRAVPEPYFAGDRALYLSAFAKMREAIAIDGLIPPEGAANMLSALYAAEPTLRQEKLALQRMYTNTFAAQARKRFRV